MSELYLIRHGQASFGAKNYDQLSELGYQQSVWLGEYFRDRDITPDKILIGGMKRHLQTADGICEGMGQKIEFEVHEGYNEFGFQALCHAYVTQKPEHDIEDWNDARQFFRLLRKVMRAWIRNEIHAQIPETWQQFEQRVSAALDASRSPGSPGSQQVEPSQIVFAVSSGGAISMALKHIMNFSDDTLIDLNLQAKNTAISHCYFNQHNTFITGFNYVPHLDTPERTHLITSA